MSDSTPTFRHNGISIPVVFTYGDAMGDLRTLGLNLLDMGHADALYFTILANDEIMLEVWWHFVKKHEASKEEAMASLTPQQMETFKEAVWQAVLNFTPKGLRVYMQTVRKAVEKKINSPDAILNQLSQDSLQELE